MAEKKINIDSKDYIWKIRELNDELEISNEKIVKFYNSQENLNDATKKLWISDIKECYYNIIAVWELIWGYNNGERDYLESSKQYLYRAQSLFSQCKSELNSFKSEEAISLLSNLSASFDKCFNAYREILNILIPQKTVNPPIKKVIKVSNSEYQILCSICGELAVSFKIGKELFDNEESLIYTGITHKSSLKKELSKELFDLLEDEAFLLIHALIKKYHIYEGLDAYCPDCDEIYCWEHYNPVEEFDDGFYDCTYGTCPKGHRRIIDD